MPAGVAGVVGMRETYREGAQAVARAPAVFADELIEGGVESMSVRRFPKRFLCIAGQPDHRSGPCRRVVRIKRNIAPHDRATLLSKLPREGAVNPNKPVLNKLLQLCFAERAHRFISIRRHEILISSGQPQSPSRGEVGEAHPVEARHCQWAAGALASSRSKRAMPLAAEEEDRSEIADHRHGSESLAQSLRAINAPPIQQANLTSHRAPGVRCELPAPGHNHDRRRRYEQHPGADEPAEIAERKEERALA